RIQYKIEVKPPTDAEFAEIMRRVCEKNGLTFYPKAAEWIAQYARERNIALRSCQPRDLMGHVSAAARFLEKKPELSPELVQLACETYFVALLRDLVFSRGDPVRVPLAASRSRTADARARD